MTSPAIQFDQLDSVPLAVIRREARASELSRVVPKCCGLVWYAVRAQQAKAGRHVAIYWGHSISLEVGVALYGPFAEEGGGPFCTSYGTQCQCFARAIVSVCDRPVKSWA